MKDTFDASNHSVAAPSSVCPPTIRVPKSVVGGGVQFFDATDSGTAVKGVVGGKIELQTVEELKQQGDKAKNAVAVKTAEAAVTTANEAADKAAKPKEKTPAVPVETLK
jgi:hypothetical protein